MTNKITVLENVPYRTDDRHRLHLRQAVITAVHPHREAGRDPRVLNVNKNINMTIDK